MSGEGGGMRDYGPSEGVRMHMHIPIPHAWRPPRPMPQRRRTHRRQLQLIRSGSHLNKEKSLRASSRRIAIYTRHPSLITGPLGAYFTFTRFTFAILQLHPPLPFLFVNATRILTRYSPYVIQVGCAAPGWGQPKDRASVFSSRVHPRPFPSLQRTRQRFGVSRFNSIR